MKKVKWMVVAISFCTALMMVSCTDRAAQNTLLAGDAPSRTVIKALEVYTPKGEPEGMEYITQNGYVALYADMGSGAFAVEDMRDGTLWYSNPSDSEEDNVAAGAVKNQVYSQLLVTDIEPSTKTVKTKNSYIACEKKGGITVSRHEQGITVLYRFVKEEYEIPVVYTLLEDSVSARIDTKNIKENGAERILKISLLPMMGAQNQNAEGYLLLAGGSGSLIRFNNGKTANTSMYRAQVYGEDPVYVQTQRQNIQENYSLPVFGIQAQNHGLLAISDAGAAEAFVNASVNGLLTSYSNAYFEFQIRGSQSVTIGDAGNASSIDVYAYESKDIKVGPLGVRYFLLGTDSEGLSGMAGVTREYLITNLGLKPSVSETAPVYLSVPGAMQYFSSFMGIRTNVVDGTATLGQTLSMASGLESRGVRGMRVLYDNWSASQLDGKIVSSLDLIGKCGSRQDMKKLSEYLQAADGSLALTAGNLFYNKNGNGVSLSRSSIRDINGMPSKQPVYRRDVFFPDDEAPSGRVLIAPRASERLSALVNSIGSGGVNTQVMLGQYGNTLYTDFGEGGYRRYQVEESVKATLAGLSGTQFIGDNANFYALPYVAEVVNIPGYSTEYDIVDESVAFYQMVLHGVKPYGSRAINTYGSPQDMYLQCIATGMTPHYELMYSGEALIQKTGENSYYGAQYAYWQDTIVKQYQDYEKLYEKAGRAYIKDIQKVRPELVKTVYDNGVYTLVNFGGQDIQWGNRPVPAKSFIIVAEEMGE